MWEEVVKGGPLFALEVGEGKELANISEDRYSFRIISDSSKSGVQMCSGDCGYAPEIKWTDGMLTLKTAGSVQCTAQITLTYHDTTDVAFPP